jgi:hypothetical protein
MIVLVLNAFGGFGVPLRGVKDLAVDFGRRK